MGRAGRSQWWVSAFLLVAQIMLPRKITVKLTIARISKSNLLAGKIPEQNTRSTGLLACLLRSRCFRHREQVCRKQPSSLNAVQ